MIGNRMRRKAEPEAEVEAEPVFEAEAEAEVAMVTYWSRAAEHRIRLPHNNRVIVFSRFTSVPGTGRKPGVPGLVKLAPEDQLDALFKGEYRTTNPAEIAFLDERTDQRSPKYDFRLYRVPNS